MHMRHAHPEAIGAIDGHRADVLGNVIQNDVLFNAGIARKGNARPCRECASGGTDALELGHRPAQGVGGIDQLPLVSKSLNMILRDGFHEDGKMTMD